MHTWVQGDIKFRGFRGWLIRKVHFAGWKFRGCYPFFSQFLYFDVDFTVGIDIFEFRGMKIPRKTSASANKFREKGQNPRNSRNFMPRRFTPLRLVNKLKIFSCARDILQILVVFAHLFTKTMIIQSLTGKLRVHSLCQILSTKNGEKKWTFDPYHTKLAKNKLFLVTFDSTCPVRDVLPLFLGKYPGNRNLWH